MNYTFPVGYDIRFTQRLIFKTYNYILVQGFRVSCLFTGQYNTKGYDKITGFVKLLDGLRLLSHSWVASFKKSNGRGKWEHNRCGCCLGLN